jgi:hypothetical protein
MIDLGIRNHRLILAIIILIMIPIVALSYN